MQKHLSDINVQTATCAAILAQTSQQGLSDMPQQYVKMMQETLQTIQYVNQALTSNCQDKV